jgi:response regulator NasT
MSETPDRDQLRILVADDDPILVQLVAGWLQTAGYEVLEANDSTSAMRECIAHNPHLAIIDYEMPGYCGTDLARFIHSQTDVALIFLSSHGERAIIDAAISSGAFAYLQKPVEEADLLQAVRTALERGGELRELRARTSNLGNALQTARTVSLATGLLMGRLRTTQSDAFDRLRQQARSNRKKIEEVATELLEASEESARLFRQLAGDLRAETETLRVRPGKGNSPRG